MTTSPTVGESRANALGPGDLLMDSGAILSALARAVCDRNDAVAAVRWADSRLTEAIGRATAAGLKPEDIGAALAPLEPLMPLRDLPDPAGPPVAPVEPGDAAIPAGGGGFLGFER